MTEGDRRQQAWAVYAEHQDVFAAVLTHTGPWGVNDGLDLVHDFLVDRLPQALVSYDARIGPLPPWLYRVFANYARKRRLERAAVQKRWQSLAGVGEPAAPASDEGEAAADDRCVGDALGQLAPEERDTLHAYFGRAPEAGNVRAVARRFRWSRHRARQVLLQALGALAARLHGTEALTGEEADVCQAYLAGGEGLEGIGRRLHKSEDEIGSLLRGGLKTLGASLVRVFSQLTHEEE
jgi:DNA-directed RNA polymerase specialized sigma24 family protein